MIIMIYFNNNGVFVLVRIKNLSYLLCTRLFVIMVIWYIDRVFLAVLYVQLSACNIVLS